MLTFKKSLKMIVNFVQHTELKKGVFNRLNIMENWRQTILHEISTLRDAINCLNFTSAQIVIVKVMYLLALYLMVTFEAC